MRLSTVFITMVFICVLVLTFYAAGLCMLGMVRYINMMDETMRAIQQMQLMQDGQQNDLGRLEQKVDRLTDDVSGLTDIFSRASTSIGTFEVTAYTDSCGNGDGFTATGTIPTVGRTIAVDPRKIPLGSHVWIEGLGWHVAEDVGGAVKGNVLDLYVGASVSKALQFGRQQLRAVVTLQ